mgnify:CR=1 FL=1
MHILYLHSLSKKIYAGLLEGKTVRIKNLFITKNSYFITNQYGNRKIVQINSLLREPMISSEQIVLFDNHGNTFYEIPLETYNSPVLLELVKILKPTINILGLNLSEDKIDLNKVDKNFSISKSYWLYFCGSPEKEMEFNADGMGCLSIILLPIIVVSIITTIAVALGG